MQEGVLGQQHPHETPKDTQRRETVRMQIMLAQVQPERQSEQAHAGARHQRHASVTHAFRILRIVQVLNRMVG